MASKQKKYAVIVLTFIAALALMIVPLPEWAEPYRPDWIVLTLIYWCMATPREVDVGIGWIVGLFVDVLKGVLLGQYALGFALTALICIRLHQRVRNYPLHQQALFVGMILLPYMSLSLWIYGVLDRDPESWLYWAPVVTSVFVWPWIYLILRAVRRAASIS